MAMRGVIERPSGLSYRDDLIPVDEERELLERLHRLEVTPLVMHGVPSRRLTHAFGVGYDFDHDRLAQGRARLRRGRGRHLTRLGMRHALPADRFRR
jgi:hypothetical protein